VLALDALLAIPQTAQRRDGRVVVGMGAIGYKLAPRLALLEMEFAFERRAFVRDRVAQVDALLRSAERRQRRRDLRREPRLAVPAGTPPCAR